MFFLTWGGSFRDFRRTSGLADKADPEKLELVVDNRRIRKIVD